MSKPDLGKWAEGKAQDWMTKRAAARADFFWHRLPDARSAQGALSKQPADYLTAQAPYTYLFLEVKETAQKNRLPKDKISQYGKLKAFFLAGFDCRVLVYRSAYEDWVVFRGSDLFSYVTVPPSFPFEGQPTFLTHNEALESIFR